MVPQKAVFNYTARQIARLSSGSGGQKAALAELRRGVGKEPGEDPGLWGAFLLDLPEELYGKDGKPSRAEWAIYITLTLYALHQQGKDPAADSVSAEGEDLGKAAAGLAQDQDDRDRILRRFSAMVTAADMRELSHHLRGLVQLMKARGIRLDYPALAEDLYWWQVPSRTNQVKLKWGQGFYGAFRAPSTSKEDES